MSVKTVNQPTVKLNLERLERAFPEAYFDFASGCAERGYDDKPVILTNWNHVPDKVFDGLERLNYACEWNDEWTTCGNCGKAVRTNADSYGWSPSYIIFDDTSELFCIDCAEYDMDEYYQSLENEPTRAVTEHFAKRYPLTDSGYRLLESGYEAGLHPHQTADPKAILARLLQSSPDGRFVFVLDGRGQFDVDFSVWKREKPIED